MAAIVAIDSGYGLRIKEVVEANLANKSKLVL